MARRRGLSIPEFKALMAGGAGRTHEDAVQAAINMLCLQSFGGVRAKAWRVDTGVHLMPDGKGGWITGRSYGEKGALDITGIIPPHGLRFDVDIKMPGDKLREEQTLFIAESHKRGGIAFAHHDGVDNLIEQFNEALREQGGRADG